MFGFIEKLNDEQKLAFFDVLGIVNKISDAFTKGKGFEITQQEMDKGKVFYLTMCKTDNSDSNKITEFFAEIMESYKDFATNDNILEIETFKD